MPGSNVVCTHTTRLLQADIYCVSLEYEYDYYYDYYYYYNYYYYYYYYYYDYYYYYYDTPLYLLFPRHLFPSAS